MELYSLLKIPEQRIKIKQEDDSRHKDAEGN